MNRDIAIQVSLDTYKRRQKLKYPFFKAEYSEYFSEEEYIEHNKCGFCIMHYLKCKNCEFGKKFGICTQANSLYSKYSEKTIYDIMIPEAKRCYTREQIKDHEDACQTIIDALESMKEEPAKYYSNGYHVIKVSRLVEDGIEYNIIVNIKERRCYFLNDTFVSNDTLYTFFQPASVFEINAFKNILRKELDL